MRKTMLAALCCALAAWAQKPSGENQVRDRGQTPVPNNSQILDYGRFGRRGNLPTTPQTLNGTLVDASCRDRTAANLAEAPLEPAMPDAQPQATNRGSVSAKGVTIDAATVDTERADIMAHQVPDLRSRIADPTCGVTGNTHAFALLTDTGRLLNLDEGGNTYAAEGVQATKAGRAMLSGSGAPFKPKASIKGFIRGDQLVVSEILRMEP